LSILLINLDEVLMPGDHRRLIHQSAWKRNSANFAFTEFSEVPERPRSNFLAQARRLTYCGRVATRIPLS
jgi:hypothetical protein